MAALPKYSSYLLPSHPSEMVADPLSVCEDYDSLEVPKWKMVTKLLGERSVTNFHELEDVITTLKPDAELGTLRTVLNSMDSSDFFSHVLPGMCVRVLQTPELFPTGELAVLPPGEMGALSLTREQVACLLSHMFFCTLKPPHWSQYWADFSIWYNSSSTPVRAYLQTLITYFSQLDDISNKHGVTSQTEFVSFHRRVLTSPPDWKSLTSVISHDLFVPSHELEPPPEVDVEVDFANKDIGFGVSGSQEEVLLAMSPETCIVMLIVPTLRDNESVMIQGARRVGRYEGIGRHVRFTGPVTETKDWSSRIVIAMDALELDTDESDDQISELQPEKLRRELNKAYCGFYPFQGKPFSAVSTGHWGCGAFGGHRYTKALIQVMAAANAKTKLVFHDIPATPVFVTEVTVFLALLGRHGVTVGRLYSALLEVGSQSDKLMRGHTGSGFLKILEQKLELHT